MDRASAPRADCQGSASVELTDALPLRTRATPISASGPRGQRGRQGKRVLVVNSTVHIRQSYGSRRAAADNVQRLAELSTV